MSDSLNTRRPRRERRDLGDLTKGEKEATTRFTVDLPDSLHHTFKMQAAAEGRSMKDLVVEVLETYLNYRG